MPPDNSTYFYAAYGATAAAYVLYAASIWLRARRLRDRSAALRSVVHD